MTPSLEEFRSLLLDPASRRGLGIDLSDVQAQQVCADPRSSQDWYAYWLSLGGQPAADPVASTTAAPTTTPVLGGHDFTRAGAFASEPASTAATPLDQTGGGTPFPNAAPPTARSRVGLWVTLSLVGAFALIAATVVIVAFVTARHWTKIDVPEKPETFHSEEYETGLYLVSDDGVSPCVVDQDWTDCITAMEAQYAGACAGVELVPNAAALCGQHRAEIDRMRAEDSEGSVVASLGDFGHLTRTPETATRQVSNNDHEPAVTHQAVCYLGFLGECE